MNDNVNGQKQAIPRQELMRELLDSNEPKTAREHAAVRAIEELLEALEEVLGWETLCPIEVYEQARAAIRKARGEE